LFFLKDKTDTGKRVKNNCLFEVFKNSGSAFHTSSREVRNTLTMYLYSKIGEEWDSYEDFEKCVKGKIEGFCSSVNKKWIESNRCMSTFLIKNKIWLIGQLSEEAQGSRNKDYIRLREPNTRKSSCVNTNTDLFNFLLITSDPVITELRPQSKVSSTELPP